MVSPGPSTLNALWAEVIVSTPTTQLMQKMAWEGQCTPLQGRCFTFTWMSLAPPYLAQLCVAHSHLLACRRKHASQAEPELEAERHEGMLFTGSGWCFFCPRPCSLPSFCKFCFVSLDSGNSIRPALFCRQSAVFHLFLHFLLPCTSFALLSEVQAVFLHAVTAHSTRGSRPHVSSCVSKI